MQERYQNPDYLSIPNYERSIAPATIDASDLTPQNFQSEYVNRNRPCLVKGAARHWNACELWQSPEYLKSRCGDVKIEVHRTPVIEADKILSTPEKMSWLAMLHLTHDSTRMRFAEFIDQATSEREDLSELFFLYSIPLGPGGPFEALQKDVALYTFLRNAPKALFNSYPRNNVFFYRSSLTDWHYHHAAEALQTQILGTKEVLLLPPTESVWSYMFALQSERLHIYDADLSAFPQAQQVVPYRVVLHPGDALYIPTYWWHLVSTRGNRSLGATVPTWWRSPLHIQCDTRIPAFRALTRAVLSGAVPKRQAALLCPFLIAGVMWSTIRRSVQA